MNTLTDFLRSNPLAVAAAVFIMCVITFAAFAADKLKAINGSRRISERTLLSLCFLFGALGGLLAMYLVRHKTKKAKFYCLVPLFLVLQTILVCAVYI